MDNALTESPVSPPPWLTTQDLMDRATRIHQVLTQVMQRGVHYGTIPGCGDKPGLFKAGAEKILSTFQMGVIPDQEHIRDLSEGDTVRVRVIVPIIHGPTGRIVGHGIGECSSAEEKYAWKKALCQEEWDAADPMRRREKWKSAQGKPYKILQVAIPAADVANTVLKMAKKRALVDGALTATGCSDMFEQGEDEAGDHDEGFDREKATVESAGPRLPKYLQGHAGKTVSDPSVPVEVLEGCHKRLAASITKGYPPERKRFEADDRKLASALAAEIARRHSGTPDPALSEAPPRETDDDEAWRQTCDELTLNPAWVQAMQLIQVADPRILSRGDRPAMLAAYKQCQKPAKK